MDLVNPTTPERPSPRERLLQAADHLFYEEGVSSVGIDRILKESDVARASLYSTYGSKDQLLRAYLQNRSHGWQAVVAEALPTRWDTARDRIVGIFEMLTEWFEAPGYHGCPFINASAEAAPSRRHPGRPRRPPRLGARLVHRSGPRRRGARSRGVISAAGSALRRLDGRCATGPQRRAGKSRASRCRRVAPSRSRLTGPKQADQCASQAQSRSRGSADGNAETAAGSWSRKPGWCGDAAAGRMIGRGFSSTRFVPIDTCAVVGESRGVAVFGLTHLSAVRLAGASTRCGGVAGACFERAVTAQLGDRCAS